MELVFNSTTIKTHSNLLQVRASRFYSQLCHKSQNLIHDARNTIAFDKASPEYVKGFVRNVYSKCALSKEEEDVVKYLKEIEEPYDIAKNECNSHKFVREASHDSVLSPESDIYLTPNCSPSDFFSTFCEEQCSDIFSEKVKLSGAVDELSNLHRTNRSYYTIVAVDEVFREESNVETKRNKLESEGVLERELAEQDELLKSFRSIQSKEESKSKTKKIRKPTSLPVSSSLNPKTPKHRSSVVLFKTDTNKKETNIPVSRETANFNHPETKHYGEKNGSEVFPVSTQRNLNSVSRVNESIASETQASQKSSPLCCFACTNDVDFIVERIKSRIPQDVVEEEEEFMCSPETDLCGLKCCQKKDIVEDLLTLTPCSPEMDASGGGPDSGLDTCSTGCIPGGGFNSPREHTVSETSGVDLTEAAIGEDMPHDGETELNVLKPNKSSDSSSVSSEVGTWDTSFPTSNVQEVRDKKHETKIGSEALDTTKLNVDVGIAENSETSLNTLPEDSEIVSKSECCSEMKDVQERDVGERETNSSSEVEKSGKPVNTDDLVPIKQTIKYDIVSGVLDISANDAFNGSNASENWTESCDTDMLNHRRKVSSLGDLNSEYLVDSHQPTSGEKCNDWKIDTSVGASNNYFINAATLVDDSELPTSLPPLYIRETSFEVKEIANRRHSENGDNVPPNITTKTPTSSPTEIIDKSKPSFMDSDEEMVNSQKDLPLDVNISPDLIRENDVMEETSDGETPKNKKTEDTEYEPSGMRVTFLKMGGTRHEVKLLNGQDLFAEFQKELRMTEHLEPHIGRKITGGKLKRDSESTDVHEEIAASSKMDVVIDNTLSANNDIQEKHETETVNEDHYDLKKEYFEEANLDSGKDHLTGDSPKNEENKTNEDDDIEPPRKSSLIRRNTFELDPDEEHIALLRQEYERRQGNLLFQNCIPQFSGHITGSEGFRDSQSLLILGSDSQEEIHLPNEQLMSLPSIPVTDPLMAMSMIDIDSSLPCQIPRTLSMEEHGSNICGNFEPECSAVKSVSEINYMEKRNSKNLDEECIMNNLMADRKSPEVMQNLNIHESEENIQNSALCSDENNFQAEACVYSRQSSYDIACKPVISGALTCSDLGLEDKRLWDSPKKHQKRTESTPIVSGGVSTDDFTVPLRKVSESPIMRRKNESAPILSGAAPVPLEEHEIAPEVKPPPQASAAAAWVVDMSDCSGNSAKPPLDLRKHKKSDSTAGLSNSDAKEELSSSTAAKRSDIKTSSLGFFVDLKVSPEKEQLECKPKEKRGTMDMRLQKSLESTPVNVGYFVGFDDSKSHGREKLDRKASSFEEKRDLRRQTSKNDDNKSSGKDSPCGFFIDLTNKETDSAGTKNMELKQLSSQEEKDYTSDKKSAIFSMFIDIGDVKQESGGRHGSSESVRSKVAASPLLSSHKKLGFRRSSTSRESSEKGSRPNSATFDIDDQIMPEDNAKKTSADVRTQNHRNEFIPPPSQPSSLEEITEHKPNKKQSFFMFIEHESPVIRRKTLPSGLRPSVNRHSWNPETRSSVQTEEAHLSSRRQHKRAHSVSVDRSAICSPGDDHKSSSSNSLAKVQQQGSSHSLCESAMSSEVGMPQMSASCHARLSSKVQEKNIQPSTDTEDLSERDYRDRTGSSKDRHPKHKTKFVEKGNSKLNFPQDNIQTLDVSSLDNVEELQLKQDSEVLVQEVTIDRTLLEPKARLKDGVKVLYEDVKGMKKAAIDSGLGESFQGAASSDSNGSQQRDMEDVLNVSDGKKVDKNVEIQQSHEVSGSRKKKESSLGNFVRLSDLDKEPVKANGGVDSSDLLPSFSTTNRMTRSIPETSWIENKLLMTRSIGNGSTSKSLSRLFPHLHTGGSAASSSSSVTYSKSPGGQVDVDDNDMQISETSDLSSMQSSMGPSGLEGSTEETDASSSYAGRSGPVSRLGEDLLRMFLEEINPDVTVEVGGRRMKAHKCILSSRCQYFAAMLSGGWVESAGNVISLQGFSYNAVHFALCHIYSGTSNIPDTISIVELATLADMLGLEGLKEVIMYTLKVKYCHFFHKPCTMCTVGVLECLPLAAAYGLDEIYRKSLRWITKYFVRIWPTKGFASLPRELVEKCYQQHVVHMSVDNVLETVMCCDKLLATLPNVRWAEPIFGITSQLLETSIKYIANNFSAVLMSENFLSLGRELSWNISRLEDSIMAATDRLPPEQCCQSYSRLHQILLVARSEEPPPEMQWSQSFVELLSRIQKRVETSLVRQAPRAARCPSWVQMEPELRRKIQEIACLVLVPGEEIHRSRLSSSGKRGTGSGSNTYGTGSRSVSSTGLRSLDLRQVRLAMTQQARRAASGGRVSTLKADSKTKVQIKQAPVVQVRKEVATTDDSSKASNGETSSTTSRPKTWPMRVLENKSRPTKYRVNSSTSSTATPEKPASSATRRSGKIMISSSDSSRTSSPAMKRSAPCSDASGRVRASTLTSASGRNTVNRSETPPGRDLRNRRKRDGDVAAISTDSLTESPSNGSTKRSTKEISESTTSRSCISTRPDTPSVRRKAREEALSADSLSSTVHADKAISRNGISASAANHSVTVRPDTPKARKKNLLGKLGAEVTISTDSLATDSSLAGEISTGSKDGGKSSGSNKSEGKGGKLVKMSNTKNEVRSPVSAIWKVNRQSVSSPRDSPTARVRSAVSSSPYTGSPSLRRSLLMASKSENTSSPSSAKQITSQKGGSKSEKITTKILSSPSTSSTSSKRTQSRSQVRNQAIASPAKPVEGSKSSVGKAASKDASIQYPVSKSNSSKSIASTKKTTNGPITEIRSKRQSDIHPKLPPLSKRETGEERHPSVGSRSGTFLKDEPTILKKPDVDNVQE